VNGHARVIVVTEARDTLDDLRRDADGVYRPVCASPSRLHELIRLVPQGDENDHTRLPAFYDASFDYLRGLGVPVT
jgi:hypothetical protein